MKRILIIEKTCPHCQHTRAFNKLGTNVKGVFCTRCGKENKGWVTKLNKHKKSITIPVI